MSNLRDFYSVLGRCLEAREAAAVATIVRTRGSSPREVGAKMLVHANGMTDGTVGGGCGEADVWRTALTVLADLEPRSVYVDLTDEINMTSESVCGGIMEIFVEPFAPATSSRGEESTPSRGNTSAVTRGLLQAMAAKQPALTATVVERSGSAPCAIGAKLLVVAGEPHAGDLGWPVLQEQVLADVPGIMAEGGSHVRTYAFESGTCNGTRAGDQVSVFFELALPQPVLVIVGAGHIAVPVAQVGKLLDFEVAVIDDRPSFANAARFPTVDRIIVDDFEAALDGFPITPSTYVVLVTRGHVHDVRSLRKIIHASPAYIGMIGSRRRVFAVFKLLHDEGVPTEALLRVHAPIGLDIKTETPGEIAVSIGAEILKVRRGGGAASRSDLLRRQYLYTLTRGDQRNS